MSDMCSTCGELVSNFGKHKCDPTPTPSGDRGPFGKYDDYTKQERDLTQSDATLTIVWKKCCAHLNLNNPDDELVGEHEAMLFVHFRDAVKLLYTALRAERDEALRKIELQNKWYSQIDEQHEAAERHNEAQSRTLAAEIAERTKHQILAKDATAAKEAAERQVVELREQIIKIGEQSIVLFTD